MHSRPNFAQLIATLAKATWITTLTLTLGGLISIAKPAIGVPNLALAESSVTDKQISATIYLLDPQTLELVPRLVSLPADSPVTSAVKQIMAAYHGQDIGIKDCEVKVNPNTQEAIINFKLDNPQGADAFHTLSSANQLALIESMRETLLNHPIYNIKNVIFTANDVQIEI